MFTIGLILTVIGYPAYRLGRSDVSAFHNLCENLGAIATLIGFALMTASMAVITWRHLP